VRVRRVLASGGAVTLFFARGGALLTKSIVVGERGRLIGSGQSVSQSVRAVCEWHPNRAARIESIQSKATSQAERMMCPSPCRRPACARGCCLFFFFLLFFFVSLFFVTCRPWAWMTPALLATLPPPPLLALLAARSDQPIAEPRVREALDRRKGRDTSSILSTHPSIGRSISPSQLSLAPIHPQPKSQFPSAFFF